jgi:predicted nucleic acid-binding Zn ribbon protein
MPTYEYYCEANGQSVDVVHAMSTEMATWGELCNIADIACGETQPDAPVIRQLSAIASLIPKGGSGPRGGMSGGKGGCCGGGCGCNR